MSWPILHVLLLTALALACLRVAKVAVQHLALLAACAAALIAAAAAGIIADAHLTHAQLASHTRQRRHQRLFAKTPLLTVAAFPAKSIDDQQYRRPDYRALTNQLQHCILSRREFRSAVGSVSVHSGLPTAEEVSAGGGNIALYCGGSWHGLFQKPSFNRFLKVCGGLHEVVLGFRAAGSLELPIPTIAFDFPGKLEWLNCGQTDDCAVLDYVYQRLITAYPTARIILMADCLGSLRALNWLGNGPANVGSIAAICLESPLVRLETFMRGLTAFRHVNSAAYAGLCAIMPNFSSAKNREYNFLTKPSERFPNVPVFVGLLDNDSVSGPAELDAVVKRFSTSRLFVFVARGEYVDGVPLRHGHLVRCSAYRTAFHTFLRQIGVVQLSDTVANDNTNDDIIRPATAPNGGWRPAKSSLTEYAGFDDFSLASISAPSSVRSSISAAAIETETVDSPPSSPIPAGSDILTESA